MQTTKIFHDDPELLPDEAWRLVTRMLDWIVGFFGDFAGMIAKGVFTRDSSRFFSPTIRAAETIARQMVLTRVPAFEHETAPPPPAPQANRPRTNTPRTERADPLAGDDPSKWRVSFSMRPPMRRKRRRRRAFSRRAPMRITTRRLAARIEALRRVIADPDPTARRFARRIRRMNRAGQKLAAEKLVFYIAAPKWPVKHPYTEHTELIVRGTRGCAAAATAAMLWDTS